MSLHFLDKFEMNKLIDPSLCNLEAKYQFNYTIRKKCHEIDIERENSYRKGW